MTRFKQKTRTYKSGTSTITETWNTDAKLEFIINEGDKIAEEVFATFSKSYGRQVPKETGELAEGFKERDGRRIGNIISRQSLFTNVPYAKFVEYGTPKTAKLGIMPKLIRSARTKLRKEFNARVIKKISDR